MPQRQGCLMHHPSYRNDTLTLQRTDCWRFLVNMDFAGKLGPRWIMIEIRQGHNMDTLFITPEVLSYGSHSYNQNNLSSTESTVLTDIERGSVRIYGSSRTVRTNPLDQIGNWEISSFTCYLGLSSDSKYLELLTRLVGSWTSIFSLSPSLNFTV